MSLKAPEEDGPHSRKRSRGNEERPRERERPARDEKERPARDEKDRSERDEKERPERDEKERSERDGRPPRSRRDVERDARRRDERRNEEGRRHFDLDDPSKQRRRRFRDSLAAPPPDGKGTAKEGGGGIALEGADVLQRSRAYFQHDERGAGHGGRDMVHRATEQGRWAGPKEHAGNRLRDDRSTREDSLKKYDTPQPKLDDQNAWKHDGFYELEAEAPPLRKRPAFREKKPEGQELLPGEFGNALATRREKSGVGPEAREDAEVYNPRWRERHERSYAGGSGRDMRRADGAPPRYGPQFRDRFGGMSDARGRDRFIGRRYDTRNFHQPVAVQVEKWKHDLYEEANRSPTPKHDEDKLAKLEALLAS